VCVCVCVCVCVYLYSLFVCFFFFSASFVSFVLTHCVLWQSRVLIFVYAADHYFSFFQSILKIVNSNFCTKPWATPILHHTNFFDAIWVVMWFQRSACSFFYVNICLHNVYLHPWAKILVLFFFFWSTTLCC